MVGITGKSAWRPGTSFGFAKQRVCCRRCNLCLFQEACSQLRCVEEDFSAAACTVSVSNTSVLKAPDSHANKYPFPLPPLEIHWLGVIYVQTVALKAPALQYFRREECTSQKHRPSQLNFSLSSVYTKDCS